MAEKKSRSPSKPIGRTSADRANISRVEQTPKDAGTVALAHASLQPTVQAALTLMDWKKDTVEVPIDELVRDLNEQCDQATRGDLSRAEAMLTAQAHTLDSIFHNLTRKALHCEQLSQMDANLRLALKAQSQCRAALEALAEIKHPKSVAIVRQANIANGPQQVNNGGSFSTSTRASARAREMHNQQNELLERNYGQRLDAGATSPSGGANKGMEAVGVVDGANVKRR